MNVVRQKHNLSGWTKPFEFSNRDKVKLRSLLAGRPNIEEFIDSAQDIVKTWRHINTAKTQLTEPAELKESALKIARSAAKLTKLLNSLAEDADTLLDQELWTVNHAKYPVQSDSLATIKQSLIDLGTAGKLIANIGGKRSAPTKYANTQAIAAIGNLFEKCFSEKPMPTTSKADIFYRSVSVCVPGATHHLIKMALAR